jgi:hypothetical protein
MMGTMFIQQGSLMDNRVALPGTGVTLRIPAATMALFNTGAIILLVPLYDTFFEPALKRCGVRWTLLRRIGEQGGQDAQRRRLGGGRCTQAHAWHQRGSTRSRRWQCSAGCWWVGLHVAALAKHVQACSVCVLQSPSPPCTGTLSRSLLLRLPAPSHAGWGMVIAVLAMVYSAAVETWRLDIFRSMPDSGGDSSEPGVGYGPAVVPLSIMWQAPAYVLIGASEVLASIAQLEFFYDQAPDVMRSCSMALQLLSTAVGSYLGGGLVAAVAALSVAAGQPWLPKDLNLGHLDWFLLLCGGLMAANSVLFVLVANNYEYKVRRSTLSKGVLLVLAHTGTTTCKGTWPAGHEYRGRSV